MIGQIEFKIQFYFEKYLHFLTSEIQEKTALDIIDKAYNNSVLVLVFDKNDHLIYQNREIHANLKYFNKFFILNINF